MDRKAVDRSLPERQRIVSLLEKAGEDDISAEELEAIGLSIKPSGRRAVDMLVRRLWSERRGELIARYTYLLDFFEDDDLWLEELVTMAITRKDLEQEASFALLQALEGYGIDTGALPLESIPVFGSAPAAEVVPVLLGMGFSGKVRLIGDLLSLEPEFRSAVVAELAEVPVFGICRLLQVIAGIDDPEIAETALQTLGRIRSEEAADVLAEIMVAHPDEVFRIKAATAARRLRFLGIQNSSHRQYVRHHLQSFYASSPDSYGNQTVCFTIAQTDGLLTALFLQLNDVRGMMTVMGQEGVTDDFYAQQLEDIRSESVLLPISEELCFSLIKDAIQRNRDHEIFLPPEYYLLRWLLDGKDWPSEIYTPRSAALELPLSFVSPKYTAASAALFDEPFFSGWIETGDEVYDIAEAWLLAETESSAELQADQLDRFLCRFIDAVVTPKLELIVRRLFIASELLEGAASPPLQVKSCLSAAATLKLPLLHVKHHPFLRRLALESLLAAREALKEGYDPRKQGLPDYWDDDDEWV